MYKINHYTVENQPFTFIEVRQSGIKVTFMDYGATIMSIFTKDKTGKYETILMAYDSLDSYIENDAYLNATIGPNSGRIKDGKFMIDDTTYQVEKNFENNSNLHSGSDAFSFQVFDYDIHDTPSYTRVTFTLHAKEQNFPGNKEIKIVYTVKNQSLLIEFIGQTDKPTLLNMTNHAYFNLSGNLKRPILDHYLQINSSKHLALDKHFVPEKVTSNIQTKLDFKTKKQIKDNFFEGIEKTPTKGIDEPLLLDTVNFNDRQVYLYDEVSGRKLEIYTTYECVVCYTHNNPNKHDLLFDKKQIPHMGVCFETQHAPNGINIKGQNNSILRPGDTYYEKTLFKF
ncbi:MAG: galactose mutarotase [Candidatus Izimaplasma sp.]|nr:galactose mutarotase [Candidatus Izimaplasma bacterium]